MGLDPIRKQDLGETTFAPKVPVSVSFKWKDVNAFLKQHLPGFNLQILALFFSFSLEFLL